MTSPNAGDETKSARMPVLFVGHGSPMNALEENQWSRTFASLGRELLPPTAVLVISAHWFVDGTYLTGDSRPRTIHDFSGFPRALYEIEYPAPGRIELATRILALLGQERAALRTDWGFDHGNWSILRWMYPRADVPVIQLSIDRRLGVRKHYELARSLAPLRDEGILILGSGNVVHNLSDAFRRMQSGDHHTPDWATRFDDKVAKMLIGRDTEALLSAAPDSEDGRVAHPSPDHWLPLIYAYGASDDEDPLQFPAQGFDLGSISMRQVRFG